MWKKSNKNWATVFSWNRNRNLSLKITVSFKLFSQLLFSYFGFIVFLFKPKGSRAWNGSCRVVQSLSWSGSLLPHGLQHPKLPSLSPGVCWFMSTEWMIPVNHLILCRSLLLLPSLFPTIMVFSKELSSLHQVAKLLELQLQLQTFQWVFGVDLLKD